MRITVRYGNFGRERRIIIPVDRAARDAAIKGMARDGMTAQSIATGMGMSVGRIHQICRGLVRGPVGQHTERDAGIAMDVQAGHTLRAVARAYGLTPQRVHQIARRYAKVESA